MKGMTEKFKKVVFDAGPIIHLDELNCLELLGEFQEILLAEGVWDEIKLYRPWDNWYTRKIYKTRTNET